MVQFSGPIIHLLFDLPLTPAEAIDFGIDTDTHYRVFQTMVRGACGDELKIEDDETSAFMSDALCQVILELDDALGNSAKLNALVQKYVPDYAPRVQFYTTWDRLFESRIRK